MLSTLSVRCWSVILGITMGLESELFRLMAVSVNSTATPAMLPNKDQEMFKDPSPISVTLKSDGIGGGPFNQLQ